MHPLRRHLSHLAAASIALVAIISATIATVGPSTPTAVASPTVSAVTPDPLTLLPLQSDGAHIVDAAGRQVLLRGANVNSLGEYWQGLPAVAPTIPLTATDWDTMASHGFSVIRLIVTWSRVEPTRGVIDDTYLDAVDATIRTAADHGIYTVIDMHQDAYSAFISTTDPITCPAGTQPARGWDGAPAWAVDTGGLSTCLTSGDRNSSPAVTHAWNAFYDNVGGIRTEFTNAWAAIATRFAGRPEVAGYDLLNEPEVSRPAADLAPLYNDLLGDTIRAIRAAETAQGASFGHLIFIEPAIPAADLSRGIVIPDPVAAGVDTTNLVAAPHNYAESITQGITIEAFSAALASVAAGIGVPTWIGEYGFWDTSHETLAKIRRYAADEDSHVWGGAWWQWRQSCGDPHSVHWGPTQVEGNPGEQVHLNVLGCPGNTDLGPNEEFLQVLGRGYPRAAPGIIDHLVSDPDTDRMRVDATATTAGGQLVVWTPSFDDADHRVNVAGLTDVHQRVVPGGRIITATVAAPGSYALSIGPAEDLTLPTAPAPQPPATAGPATPVGARPTYTG